MAVAYRVPTEGTEPADTAATRDARFLVWPAQTCLLETVSSKRTRTLAVAPHGSVPLSGTDPILAMRQCWGLFVFVGSAIPQKIPHPPPALPA